MKKEINNIRSKRSNIIILKIFNIFLVLFILLNLIINVFPLEIRRSNTYDLNHLKDEEIIKDSLKKNNIEIIEDSKDSNVVMYQETNPTKNYDENYNNSMLTGLFSFGTFSSSSFIVLCILISFIIVNLSLHFLHTK
jgi:uncharacterized membrane protein